jgi:hypothetical protein
MTRHFETAKHLQKRHFVQKIPTDSQEKIAAFKGTIESSTHPNEKAVVKKSEITITTPASDSVVTPMMAVKKDIHEKAANQNWRDRWRESGRKSLHSVHHFFTSLFSYF